MSRDPWYVYIVTVKELTRHSIKRNLPPSNLSKLILHSRNLTRRFVYIFEQAGKNSVICRPIVPIAYRDLEQSYRRYFEELDGESDEKVEDEC